MKQQPTRPLTRKERMRAWVLRNVKPTTTDTAQQGVQQTAEKRPA
jgi:hypothetical protein